MTYVAREAEQPEEATQNNYISKPREIRQAGGSNFSALDDAGTIDFTYTKAVDWYNGLLKNLLDMGVVCIKTDFDEDIHMDAEYHAMSPAKLNNLYALVYQKAANELIKVENGDGIIWARSSRFGCQRIQLHRGGNGAASWDGMAESLKGGFHHEHLCKKM
jgi:alpha-D-xyloside xylohydrolase